MGKFQRGNAGGPGGRRVGSGRKPRPTTRAICEANQISRDEIEPRLPELIETLRGLARGGLKVVAEKWALDRETGKERLVERTVTTTIPDRQACVYLIDRVLGKPRQAVELSGPDGGSIPVAFEETLERVWGDEGAEALSVGPPDYWPSI